MHNLPIHLQLTEVSNLKTVEGTTRVVDESLIRTVSFDPKIDVSAYDRVMKEDVIITMSEFDAGRYLLKSGGKYYFVINFATSLR